MRGKRGFHVMQVCNQRITPADAGKTGREEKTMNEKTDHPRGCGENCTCDAEKNAATGSPPRMRGKPDASALP